MVILKFCNQFLKPGKITASDFLIMVEIEAILQVEAKRGEAPFDVGPD